MTSKRQTIMAVPRPDRILTPDILANSAGSVEVYASTHSCGSIVGI